MKATFLSLILIAITHLWAYGQQCYECKRDFDILIKTLNTDKLNATELEKSWQIAKKLYKLHYYDYVDTVINNGAYISRSLTKTFGDICIKAGDPQGIEYYIKYINFTDGSAEEERLFALERLFVKFPEPFLDKVGKDTIILSQLSYGFMCNRYYGAKSPFENRDYTAITVYNNSPKPVLNKNNCRKIFFETNPSLKEKYNKYKFQIDYILKCASLELQ